jgi:hypothetical protein
MLKVTEWNHFDRYIFATALRKIATKLLDDQKPYKDFLLELALAIDNN